MNKKNSLLFPAALLILFASGCATTITTRSVIQPLTDGIEQKKVTEAAGYVLIENGFDIKLINESMGLVTTEWRDVKSGADTAANVFGAFAAGMGGGSYTMYSRAMMIQIKTSSGGYHLTPKIARVAKTSTAYKVDSNTNVEYPEQDSPEGKLVIKIIEEINQYLGIENNFIWEEKQVTIQ